MEEDAAVAIEDSILLSVKKSLGLDPSLTQFDIDIIMAINTALNILTQLGVGPVEGFSISSEKETWDSFIGDEIRLNMVKTYVWLRVRLIFDPPTTNALLDSVKTQITEYEVRLNYQVDPDDTFD